MKYAPPPPRRSCASRTTRSCAARAIRGASFPGSNVASRTFAPFLISAKRRGAVAGRPRRDAASTAFPARATLDRVGNTSKHISRRDARLTRIFTPCARRSVHSANAVVAKHERVAFASTGEKINCDICQVRAASTREKRAKARPHELCTLAVHLPPRDTPSGRRRRDATGIPRDKSNVKSRGTKRKKNKIRRSRSRLLSLPIRRR